MSLEVHLRSGALEIVLRGALVGPPAAAALARQVAQALTSEPPLTGVEIDALGVTDVDPAGVAALLNCAQQARLAGVSLLIRDAPAPVYEALAEEHPAAGILSPAGAGTLRLVAPAPGDAA